MPNSPSRAMVNMMRQRGYVRPLSNKNLVALEMLNLLRRRRNFSNKDIVAINALVHILTKNKR